MGPYHQAGPVKLITFTRSGLTWMFWAMTSVRLERRAGICEPQGIHSMVRFSTPSQSSTALLISTSMPLASLVLASSRECGAMPDWPSTIPSFFTLASEPSPQASSCGWVSMKNLGSCAAPGRVTATAAARHKNPVASARMGLSLLLTSRRLTAFGLLEATVQLRRRGLSGRVRS